VDFEERRHRGSIFCESLCVCFVVSSCYSLTGGTEAKVRNCAKAMSSVIAKYSGCIVIFCALHWKGVRDLSACYLFLVC
jgi:hypothetical protein